MSSRLRYYLSSLPTLVTGIRNWLACATLPFRRAPLTLHLRNGLRFRVQTLMDVWIIKETCLDRDYETHGTQIQENWTVLDIGAAGGDFAILTAREHPRTRVLAYEPSPTSFAVFQENIRLNGVKNILAFPQAVASTSGTLSLSTAGAAVQHSTTQVSTEAAVQVQAITLEDVFGTNQLERCHFLKMDCEGGEFDILLNARPETLARIERICLEYHDGFTAFSHTDLQNHLQQNGYQVKITPNPVHAYLGFLYAVRHQE
ncbi:MAG: FkbM family methyltransferase [Anaerolineales bacterium]